MNGKLILLRPGNPSAPVGPPIIGVSKAHLSDWRAFARYLAWPPQGWAAILRFISMERLDALRLALGYREWQLAKGLAPAGIQKRLSSINTITHLAQEQGRCDWSLALRAPKWEPYRDTRGPELADARRLVMAATDAHDRAAVLLMLTRALRKNEVRTLRGCDLELDATPPRLHVSRKGQHGARKVVAIRPEVAEVLRAIAPADPQHYLWPCREDPCRPCGEAHLYRHIRALGQRCGVKVWPHALRHASITQFLESTHGDIRAARQFSDHKKLETLARYDDNRRSLFLPGMEAVTKSLLQAESDDQQHPEDTTEIA